MDNTNIKCGEHISRNLSMAIRSHISESDYDKVAEICNSSRHTLRRVIYRERKVSDKTKKSVETLIRLGIQYAQSSEANRRILIDSLNEHESEALQKLNEVL